MNSDNTPLVNRLILLVLSLILVCLVMLVVRAYQKPLAPDALVEVTESQPAAVEEALAAPVDVAPARRPASPPRPTPTNAQRLVAARRPAPLPSAASEANLPSAATELAVPPIASTETVIAVRETGLVDNVGDGKSPSTQPGEIVGFVTLSGTPKPEIPIDMGPICGYHVSGQRTTRHFVVGPNGGLANVLVYIRGADHITAAHVQPQDVPLLDQVGCMYEPYVMGVLVGQKFRVRNSDPVLHNVHATPKNNREFNFGQPNKGQVNERSFSKPELFIRMKCDVHPWMFAYISAVPHPFFSVTDTNGFFRIPTGLPAGGYTVVASHLKAGEMSRTINVQAASPNTLGFQFMVPSPAQPQGRIARAE